MRELNDKLVELDVQFRKNIDDYDDGIIVNREQLSAMPESWVESRRRSRRRRHDSKGLARTRRIQPSWRTFRMANFGASCSNRTSARGGRENVGILEEAIRVRNEIATRLATNPGWPTAPKRVCENARRGHRFLRELRGRNPEGSRDLSACEGS